jgi:hypothetical protein
VFTISFLSNYGELGGFFPKLYMFLQVHKPFLFWSPEKRKENTDLEGEKKSSAVHREVFCWKNAPKVARFRGKKINS